jgi:ribosomal protein S18 acetylase RimI-like enzyme
MMRLIADAKRDSLSIRLRVLKVNERAASFYSRLGFEETGDCGTHIEMERLP